MMNDDKTVKIILVGDDGITQHATGLESYSNVCEYHLLERNQRIYAFDSKVHGENAYVFKECKQPAHIKW